MSVVLSSVLAALVTSPRTCQGGKERKSRERVSFAAKSTWNARLTLRRRLLAEPVRVITSQKDRTALSGTGLVAPGDGGVETGSGGLGGVAEVPAGRGEGEWRRNVSVVEGSKCGSRRRRLKSKGDERRMLDIKNITRASSMMRAKAFVAQLLVVM
jgi:predicted protein tyrosine phosphatase